MTTDGPSAKLLTACYHEAGHALVADLEGVPIPSVRATATGTGGVGPVDIESADLEASCGSRTQASPLSASA